MYESGNLALGHSRTMNDRQVLCSTLNRYHGRDVRGEYEYVPCEHTNIRTGEKIVYYQLTRPKRSAVTARLPAILQTAVQQGGSTVSSAIVEDSRRGPK